MSQRPYRRQKSREEAIEILKSNRCTQFLPKITDEFIFLFVNKVI